MISAIRIGQQYPTANIEDLLPSMNRRSFTKQLIKIGMFAVGYCCPILIQLILFCFLFCAIFMKLNNTKREDKKQFIL